MEPREIPFERCVLPIVNEPNVMRWRLDFADWLSRNGHKARALWFRRVCARCEQRKPLMESFPPQGLAFPDKALAPGSPGLTPEHYLLDAWLKFRPDYWQELEGIQRPGLFTVWHFGRATLGVGSYPANHFPLLAQISSLVPAFREGWLEVVDCTLFHADQVQSLLAWPESLRTLPLYINTLRCQKEGFSNGLMQNILSLQGLHGIILSPGEFAFPCMKRLGELARNLRYLLLLGLERKGPSYRILEQLRHLPELRVLMVGDKLPTDDQIGELTAIPKLQCLHLAGQDLTDKGLLAVQEIRTLRSVVVCSNRVTRAGIYALREARPDLRVVPDEGMADIIGPA
jgi:hypothetical protein